MSHEKPASITLHGTPVSSGIAIGKVYLLEREKIHVAKRQVRDEHVEREVVRFKAAVKTASDELSRIKESIPDDEVRKHAFIIDAHLLMLQDEYFSGDVVEIIKKQHVNAEWALEMSSRSSSPASTRSRTRTCGSGGRTSTIFTRDCCG